MPEEPSPQSYIASVVNAVSGQDRTATPSPRPRGSVSAMAHSSDGAPVEQDIDEDEIDRRLVELQAQVWDTFCSFIT